MIDPKELRIGNLIYESGFTEVTPESVRQIIVASINQTVVNDSDGGWYSLGLLYPIPITPEWLERMGFFNNPVGSLRYTGLFAINNCDEDDVYWFDIGDFETPIKYVHQLQNLFFALIGEEIKIKELA